MLLARTMEVTAKAAMARKRLDDMICKVTMFSLHPTLDVGEERVSPSSVDGLHPRISPGNHEDLNDISFSRESCRTASNCCLQQFLLLHNIFQRRGISIIVVHQVSKFPLFDFQRYR